MINKYKESTIIIGLFQKTHISMETGEVLDPLKEKFSALNQDIESIVSRVASLKS